jgi:hypothetical protein
MGQEAEETVSRCHHPRDHTPKESDPMQQSPDFEGSSIGGTASLFVLGAVCGAVAATLWITNDSPPAPAGSPAPRYERAAAIKADDDSDDFRKLQEERRLAVEKERLRLAEQERLREAEQARIREVEKQLKAFQEAQLQVFEDVQRKLTQGAPGPNEGVADSMLKIGKKFMELGKNDEAAERFRRVVQEHPGTKAAAEAQELLKKLGK